MLRRRLLGLWLLAASLAPLAAAPPTAPTAPAPPAPIRITGSVLDALGRPLAGVTVALRPTLSVAAARQLAGKPRPADLAAARSDAAGRFALAAPGVGLFEVVARVPGSSLAVVVPAVEAVELPPPAAARPEFPGAPLDPAAWHPAPAGAPARPAASRPTPRAAARSGRILEEGSRRPLAGALVWVAEEAGHAVAVRTDAQGVYTLPADLMSAAPWGVAAAAAGYFPGRHALEAAGPAPTLLLRPAATVAGTVVDEAGKPVAGAQLLARAERSAGGLDPRGPVTASAADGSFRLAVEPHTRHRLTGRAAGFAPGELALEPLEPRGTRSGARLVLPRGRAAFGRVTDAGGKPIAGARVELAPSGRGLDERTAPAAATETDAAGGFAFAPLNPGRYDLAAEASGFSRTRVRAVSLPPAAEPADLGTVLLQPGATIEGIVAGPGDRPVAGAAVKLWNLPSGMREPLSQLLRRAPELSTVSDAQGRFTLTAVDQAFHPALLAQAPGLMQRELVRIELPAAEPLHLVLSPAASLSGRVRDEAGAPVADAAIEIRAAAGSSAPGLALPLAHLTTGADGRFQAGELEAGKVEVAASADGFLDAAPRTVDLAAGRETADVDFVLPAGAAVEGQVVNADGTGIADARVTASEGEQVGLLRFHRPTQTSTDGDGRFRLRGLKPGRRTLTAEHPDYRSAAKDVDLQGSSAPARVEIRLQEGLAVAGRVIDRGGRPVAGARVRLDEAAKWTAADGTFRFTGVAAGQHSLVAEKNPQGTARRDRLPVGDAPLTGLELELVPGGVIRGVLRGLSFPELAEVRIRPEGLDMPEGTVDYAGSYRIENVPPGDRRVRARVPSNSRNARGEARLAGPGAEAVLDLEFTGNLTLAGRVHRDGEPLAGALLTVHPQPAAAGGPAGDSRTAVSDTPGTFRFEGLDAGSYRLTVTHLESRTRYEEPRPIELAASRDDLEIDVPREARQRLRGRVVERESQAPVVGAAVAVDGGEAAVSAEDGSFLVAEVAPGSHRVRARKEGYSAAEATVAVEPGSDPPEVAILLSPAVGLTFAVAGPGAGFPAQVFAALVDDAGRVVGSGQYAPAEGGRVTLSQAPSGRFTLLVGAPGAATASAPVTVPVGEPRIALALPAALTVEVPALAASPTPGRLTLTRADGTPVRTVSWGGQVLQEWPTGHGRAAVPDLVPGRYTVRVAGDGKVWQRMVEVRGADTAVVLADER